MNNKLDEESRRSSNHITDTNPLLNGLISQDQYEWFSGPVVGSGDRGAWGKVFKKVLALPAINQCKSWSEICCYTLGLPILELEKKNHTVCSLSCLFSFTQFLLRLIHVVSMHSLFPFIAQCCFINFHFINTPVYILC